MDKKILLVVEDDQKVADIICNHLSEKYTVYCAGTITEAKEIIKKKHIDLICQDVILPDGSGLYFCKKEKEKDPNLKVIVLTKRIYIKDRVESFKSGADDYIPKPFFPEELELRINRLLGPADSDPGLVYSDFRLNLKDSFLEYRNHRVLLSDTERYIIEYLFEHSGRSDKDSLMKYIKTKEEKLLTENAFTVSVNRLKRKFENSLGMSVIKSRYGHGYYIGV